MAGLIANLLAGSRALTAQAKGAEIAGKNLANVNTPGYARERVTLQPRAMIQTLQGTESSGLEAMDLQQLRDRFLDASVLRETSAAGGMSARQDALSRGQTALGERLDRATDSTDINSATGGTAGGIQVALGDFFASFQALAAQPGDIASRQGVLRSAGALADRLNTADTRLARVQQDTTAQLQDEVQTANGILKAIAKLNQQIAESEIGQRGQAPELRDQRQAKLEALAGYLDFTVTPSTAASGESLQISVADGSGGSVPLVAGATQTGVLAYTGTGFTSGIPPVAVALGAGSLEARRLVSSQDLQGVRTSLASLAGQLTTAVNAAYNPTGLGANFFAPAPATGLLAMNSAVTAVNLKATDAGLAGANDVALAVSAVARRSFATGSGDAIDGTPAAWHAAVVSGLGGAVAGASSDLENQRLVLSAVQAQRDDVSGVSLDEETTDLLRFQRAFQASARFVTIMDDLLNVVVNQMGAR